MDICLFTIRSSLVSGDVRDDAFLVSYDLRFTRHVSNIHDEAVDRHHPQHGVAVQFAPYSPAGIERIHFEQGTDLFGFVAYGAGRGLEKLTDLRV